MIFILKVHNISIKFRAKSKNFLVLLVYKNNINKYIKKGKRNMLIEFVQELNQILTEVETLTRENEELKAEKETFIYQLTEVNESLNVALSSKATLESEINTLNTTIENLRNENQSLNNRIVELENQILDQANLEELKAIVGELKTLINE